MLVLEASALGIESSNLSGRTNENVDNKMEDVLIEIKHKTEDEKEIQKYILEAIQLTQEAVKKESISKHIHKPIKRIIYVPGRLLNIIT